MGWVSASCVLPGMRPLGDRIGCRSGVGREHLKERLHGCCCRRHVSSTLTPIHASRWRHCARTWQPQSAPARRPAVAGATFVSSCTRPIADGECLQTAHQNPRSQGAQVCHFAVSGLLSNGRIRVRHRSCDFGVYEKHRRSRLVTEYGVAALPRSQPARTRPAV